PVTSKVRNDRLQTALRNVLPVQDEVIEDPHHRSLASSRRFLVDRHARWTVEKVDLQSATLFLGEGRVRYRKRKHQRTRCREHAQISFHLLPPVPQRRISNPRLHPCWPFCWALVQDCNYAKVTTFQTSALSASNWDGGVGAICRA